RRLGADLVARRVADRIPALPLGHRSPGLHHERGRVGTAPPLSRVDRRRRPDLAVIVHGFAVPCSTHAFDQPRRGEVMRAHRLSAPIVLLVGVILVGCNAAAASLPPTSTGAPASPKQPVAGTTCGPVPAPTDTIVVLSSVLPKPDGDPIP